MSNGKMVTCATCGNEEPEGSRFCGNCGAPFVQTDLPASPAEPPPTSSSTRGRRLVWVAVGAAVALLVAGGAVAAVLSITGGDGSNQAIPTEPGLDSITNTTDVLPTNDATTTSAVAKDSADAAVGDVVDSVTAAVNERMSQYTERELGSPPLGAEVRNCRKDRDFSANSLLAPGGALYFCEVWVEDELYSDDGAAVIDVDGNVASSP